MVCYLLAMVAGKRASERARAVPRWESLGTYSDAGSAFKAYKAARKQRQQKSENNRKVEALLALAASYPVTFSTSASAHGSSMNPNLPEWSAITPLAYDSRRKLK